MSYTYYLQVDGLPKIAFAHVFGAPTYQKTFTFQPRQEISMEITYVTAGELYYEWEGGSSIRVPTHSLICDFRDFSFRIRAPGPHEHHTVGIRVPGQLGKEESEMTGTPLRLPLMLFDLKEGNNPFLPMIDEIISSRTMQSRGELACQGMVLQLLDRIDRYARSRVQLPYINRTYVKQAKQYIFTHMREPIQQHAIAQHLGISCEYLCSVFKKAEGITVMQFINRTKLNQLIAVMKTDPISLAEASEMYGYSDPNYVSRLYKRYFGRTVTEALRDGTE